MSSQKSSIFIFNKYYGELLKELKTLNQVLKRNVDRHHKTVDKWNEEHVVRFSLVGKPNETELETDTLQKKFGEVEIIKNLTLNDILDLVENEVDKLILQNYIYLLWCVALIYGNVDDEAVAKGCIVEVMRYHSDIKQFAEINFDTFGETIQKIGVASVLKMMYNEYSDNEQLIKGQVLQDFRSDAEKFMGNMNDSKLKGIVEEVTKSIDVEKFKSIVEPLANDNGDNPMDFMKILGNPEIMKLAQNVAGTIQNKIDKGDLSNEDIMSEAQNVLGFVQNSSSASQMGDIMGGLMNGALMGQGGKEGRNISNMLNQFSSMLGTEESNYQTIDEENLKELQKLLGNK